MSAATAKWCAGRSSVRWCRSAMPPRWNLRCVPRCARSGDATCSSTMPVPTPGTCACRYWWRSSPPFINARRSGAPPMADLYTQAISRLLFPAQERCKGHDTLRVRRQLEETQWWPRERLVDLQLQRLRRLLTLANQHVPHYRALFARLNFVPEAVSSLDELQRLPLLTKGDIRGHSDALKSSAARGRARFNTGGSSGQPLIFWIGKERVSHDVAAKWRATRWWGVDIGDPEVVVWGSPVELGAQDRLRRLRDRLMRTELLPAFEMSAARLDEFVARIRALEPRMLFGYPSSLALIARHAREHGIALDRLGIKVVFVTAERLYDAQRELIELVFGCPVANGYGGRDAGFIAHPCPAGGMHITAEDFIVEVVALDQGICACGRGLPMRKEIHGRTTDFILAADGTMMHGLALIYVVRDIVGVENFKIIQDDRLHTRVQLVTGADFAEESVTAIRAGMQRRLGAGVEVAVARVAAIPRENSGERRYVVSHVAPSVGQEASA